MHLDYPKSILDDGLESSKVRLVVKRKNKELFILESITSIIMSPIKIILRINNISFSHFTIILTLQDLDPLK